MHENRLVHRDLKSANVMLSIHGDIKISLHIFFYILSFSHF